MKKLFVLVILLNILSASCVEQQRIRTRDKVIIKGDEIPGIGGTKESPDTCLAYYDQKTNRIVIRYLH